jgi:tRNA-dihydrouridine synthase
MDLWEPLWARQEPILALAPMQDVTDLPFLRMISRYGGADLYFTEYFRVYAGSRLDKNILVSVTENPTRRPIIAQLIGDLVPDLVRSARELQAYPIAAVDLNLGCPAPVVYRKNAGGGLLRKPETVDAILGHLREAIPGRFSVKTRVGFASEEEFDQLLPIFARHSLDLLTVHGRTVKGGYKSSVRYDLIARAAATVKCPVLANGDITSAAKAREVLTQTGARGLMIGRAALANPWIFNQIRLELGGQPIPRITGSAIQAYLQDLYEAVGPPRMRPRVHIEKMKKYLNFVAPYWEPSDQFLYHARRMTTEAQFRELCTRYFAAL